MGYHSLRRALQIPPVQSLQQVGGCECVDMHRAADKDAISVQKKIQATFQDLVQKLRFIILERIMEVRKTGNERHSELFGNESIKVRKTKSVITAFYVAPQVALLMHYPAYTTAPD